MPALSFEFQLKRKRINSTKRKIRNWQSM